MTGTKKSLVASGFGYATTNLVNQTDGMINALLMTLYLKTFI
jgi:hypothetical protein